MNDRNVEDFYPLSPMQQGMLFHSLYDPDSGAYVEQLCCEIRGDFDAPAFERAWQQLLGRHAILRSAFVGEGLREPVQVVYRSPALPIERIDWRAIPPERLPAQLDAFLAADRQRGFVLSAAPLMRLALLRTDDETLTFVSTYHHALLDGWSTPIVLQEVLTLYEALRQRRAPALPDAQPYRAYIAWLRRQDAAAAEAFWRGTLAGFTAPTPLVVERALDLPGDAPAAATQAEVLPPDATALLRGAARRLRVTPNTLVQGAWALLLSRYSGEDDVLFGAVVSGRPTELPGAAEMIGLFINTLPVRVRVPADQPASAWLRALQDAQAEQRQYEHTPLVQVQSWSEVPRGRPLFESLLVFENYPVADALRDYGGSLELRLRDTVEYTHYPLTLVAGVADELVLRMHYDARRFTRESIARMLGHLRTLLLGIAESSGRPVADLPLLTDDERRRLLVDWNTTAVPFPQDRSVAELVLDAAAAHPHATAVACGEHELSYVQLVARARDVAARLSSLGIPPSAPVALCVERSPELAIGALAALLAGGAYLPIDPAYPDERIAFMLGDAGARVVLTRRSLADRLAAATAAGASEAPPHAPLILPIDDPGEAEARAAELPPARRAPDDLAYIIYTSGSTGRPKGVPISQRGLLNLIWWHRRTFGVTAADRATQIAGPGFDAVVWEIWPYLTAGASVHIVADDVRAEPERLRDWLLERRITISFAPTPLAEQLVELAWPQSAALRLLLTGGDRLHVPPPPGLPFTLVNNYGPTENSVVTTCGPVPPRPHGGDRPPSIGRPIFNTRLYVLDRALRPVPIGVPGELYIGGVGVARGYLNRPELTAAQFVADPFTPGGRLYRTGDLVRYDDEGRLEFLGRLDHQVKLRGFRIELGEIEATLARHPQVRAAAVLAREDAAGERRLVAYLVSDTELSAAELRAFLGRSLPEHMIPAALVRLDALPLTPNGKVDRAALPAPGRSPGTVRAVLPPRDELERTLAAIWQDVLGVPAVGIDDDFFELGGHSLSAVRVMAHVRERLDASVSLLDLFEARTVARLAQTIRQGQAKGEAALLVPLQERGERPPLFLVHPSGGSVHWYLELARHLGDDQPVYGIQARGVHGDAPPHSHVDEMGAAYADLVRSVQPDGPYLIAGWSLGVILAYETARQLRELGHEVALLALLDQGPAPGRPAPADDVEYLLDTFGAYIPLDAEALRLLPAEEQTRAVLEQGQHVGWIHGDITAEQFDRFVALMKAHMLAWHQYTPRPYPGHITLVRAADQRPVEPERIARNRREQLGRQLFGRHGAVEQLAAGLGARLRPRPARVLASDEQHDMGWGALAAAGVAIVEVPGDHLTMMHPPHVRILAEQLRQAIAAAQAPAAVR